MTSLIKELLAEEGRTKFDRARMMIKPMLMNKQFSSHQIMDKMQKSLDIKDTTAKTYYHMIVKELNMEDHHTDVDGEEIDDFDFGDSTGNSSEPESNKPELPDEVQDSIGDISYGDGIMGYGDYDDETDPEITNKNRAGVIRVVRNAHLVYKRQNDAGLYDELWIYNTSQEYGTTLAIKKDILSATDIPPRAMQSEDGSQKYSLQVLGDVTFLHVTNLPQ